MPGKLKGLKISNFKSFHGLNEEIIQNNNCNFLAIVGDNDSGKTSVINAIAFALGESSINLGSKNLADLEYKDNENKSGGTFVAVELKSDGGKIKLFKRTVVDNASEYTIDNEIVPEEVYTNCLEKEFKINLKTMFLDKEMIKSIIDQSPQDRVKMFEELSGSINYKKDYNGSKAKLQLLENNKSSLGEQLEPLVNEKNSIIISSQKNVKKPFPGKSEDAIKEQYYLFSLYQNERELETLEAYGHNVWKTIIEESIKELSEVIEDLSKFKKNQPNVFKLIPIGSPAANSCVNLIRRWEQRVESNESGVDCIIDGIGDIGHEQQSRVYKRNRPKLNRKVEEFIQLIFSINAFKEIRISINEGLFEFELHEVLPSNSKYFDKQNKMVKESIEKCNKALNLAAKSKEKYDYQMKRRQENSNEKDDIIKKACNDQVEHIRKVVRGKGPTIYFDRLHFEFDWSRLPDNLLMMTDEDEVEKTKKEFKDALDNFKKVKIINVPEKSEKKLNLIHQKIKIIENKIMVIERDIEKAKKKLEIRRKCLLKYCSDLEIKINEIYQVLAGQNATPLNIVVSNQEEPHLDGIELEFQGQLMSCLSKKNKTIAAIAIYFGLYNENSILLVNEIDDQLSDKQVSSIISYLGSFKSKQQIIFIQKHQETKFILQHADVIIRVDKAPYGPALSIVKS